MNTENVNTNYFESCVESWSIEDFEKSINFPYRISILEKLGWCIDECGNAWKGNYYLSNNGQIQINFGKCLPEAIEDFLKNEQSEIEYPELFDDLTKILF